MPSAVVIWLALMLSGTVFAAAGTLVPSIPSSKRQYAFSNGLGSTATADWEKRASAAATNEMLKSIFFMSVTTFIRSK